MSGSDLSDFSSSLTCRMNALTSPNMGTSVISCACAATSASMSMVQVQIPAGVGPGQQFMAQMPDGQQMAVTVPDGCAPGQMIQVQTPAGLMQVTIPPGLGPGQSFQMQVPAAEMGHDGLEVGCVQFSYAELNMWACATLVRRCGDFGSGTGYE